LIKIGDMVRVPTAKCSGIVVDLDNTHRQQVLTIMTEHGYILEKIWFGHAEVINGR
tara:strand:- start:266 stop:433 length:168 start_codon:yes stop_codon:yes gene_type:complete